MRNPDIPQPLFPQVRARGCLGQRMEPWPWGHRQAQKAQCPPKPPTAQEIPPLGLLIPFHRHPHHPHPILIICISPLTPVSILTPALLGEGHEQGPGVSQVSTVRELWWHLGTRAAHNAGTLLSPDSHSFTPAAHRPPECPRAEEEQTGGASGQQHVQGCSGILAAPHPQSCTDGGRRCPQSDPLFRRALHSTDTHPLPMHSPPSPTPRGLHRERLGGHQDPPGGRGGQSQPAPRPPPCEPRGPQGPALLPRDTGQGRPLVSKVQPGLGPAPPQ